MAISTLALSSTQVTEPKDSTNFMLNRLFEIDPFNKVPAEYDEATGRWAPENANRQIIIKPTEEMLQVREAFNAQVAKYNKHREKKGEEKMDLEKERVSWNDVLLLMKDAADRYEDKAKKGTFCIITNCFRKFSAFQAPIESLLQCVPSESWQFSLICGGIKILVQAAGRIKEAREVIFDALEQVPITLSRIEKIRRAYPPEVLQKPAQQMLFAILDLFQYSLAWLSENAFFTGVKAAFKGRDYPKPIEQKKATLKKIVEQIDQQALAELHMSVRYLRDGQEDMSASLKSIEWQGAEVLNMMKTMFGHVENLFAHQQGKRTRDFRIEAEKALERDAKLKNARKKLLNILEYDSSLIDTDLLSCLNVGENITLSAKDRTAWIMQSSAVHYWLFNSESQTLIINSEEPGGHSRHSTVSLFSAILVRALQESNKRSKTGVLLNWFCGEHVYAEPVDMIGHMLGQLVEQGLQTAEPSHFVLSGKDTDAKAWTNMLMDCIKVQLHETRVFVVVDSVSFYEDRPRRNDVMYLFDQLGRLMKDWKNETSGFELKVLATSPEYSKYLGTFLDDSRPAVLRIPEVVNGASSRMSQMALTRGLSDSLILRDEDV